MGKTHADEQEEHSQLSAKKDRMLNNALIIGGTLVLTYFIVNSITKKTRKKKKLNLAAIKKEDVDNVGVEAEEEDEPSELGKAGHYMLTLASTMLLGLAREKLSEYLESRKKNNEHS